VNRDILSSLKTLPHSPGVYLMRDPAGALLYIGKAIDLRKRVSSYFIGSENRLTAKNQVLVGVVHHIDYIPAASEREALLIEQKLIRRHQPPYNILWKDDKSYPFIKLSVKEDFPRLELTRRRLKDGNVYFGPFPAVSHIHRLLRWIWKKHLLPLRPCRIVFSESQLPPLKKVQSCIYLHTKECPAPCIGRIDKAGYRNIVDQAVLFFRGKHTNLIARWEGEMKRASTRKDYEQAAALRDNIFALSHMAEKVTLREITPEQVVGKIQSSTALKELQLALELPNPPITIEGFDISHTFGENTVASMVTFRHGKPDKNRYRKYRIRLAKHSDDYAALKEVVQRRYRRLKEERGDWPDLILIDGGPGQLSSAVASLEQVQKAHPPIISLAKENEEIYRPGVAKPVVLPKESAALQILQQVRDESHRFAVSYHRSLRKRRLLNDEGNP